MMLATESPFPQYFELNGSPLDAGKLYFGLPNQNPETAPITVYWDAAGTQPAAQPIRTLNGYPARSGTPANVFVAGDYSINVRSSSDRLLYYAPNSAEFSLAAAIQDVRDDLANTTDPAKGDAMVGVKQPGDSVPRTQHEKNIESISVLDYGADPTGVALSNAAFDKAKAVCRTLRLPQNPDGSSGRYRLENYDCQDIRLIGDRLNGGNSGVNEQTVIEGSGDLLVNFNNCSMENILIRNSAAGVAGKLITVADFDTRIGPFKNVEFQKATHHIFQGNTAQTIVDGLFEQCLFYGATVYSREYRGNLFKYAEHDCYTSSNQRGLLITSTSTALISGVFEFQKEMAVLVENTVTAVNVIKGLKFQNIHFEENYKGASGPDLKIHVTLSLARVELDSVGFYVSTAAGNVDLAGCSDLRLFEHNCEGISYVNVAGTMFTRVHPTVAGELNGLTTTGCNIQAHSGALIADRGFTAVSAINVTILAAPTPTPVAAPGAQSSRMVLVRDSTTSGVALLLMTDTAVTVAFSTIVSVTWSVVGGFLNGQTTGGSSFRVMFFNYMST